MAGGGGWDAVSGLSPRGWAARASSVGASRLVGPPDHEGKHGGADEAGLVAAGWAILWRNQGQMFYRLRYFRFSKSRIGT